MFVRLKAGDLRAIQVSVIQDPAHRERAIETYTFTIQYFEDSTNVKRVAGLELSCAEGPRMTVEATNSALQGLLQDTMRMCANMPELPGM